MIGTSIAFFVVMGDLGPPLIAKLAGIEETYNLRLIILTGKFHKFNNDILIVLKFW